VTGNADDVPLPTVLQLTLAAHPASVPTARHFVTDGSRAWRRDAFLDAAALCVTELASNAVLHSGSRFFTVTLECTPRGLRLTVADQGDVPVAAVVPRSVPAWGTADADLELETATGRGLTLVSMIASAWGVEASRSGTQVWVELADRESDEPVGPSRTDPARTGAAADVLPPGWRRVVLADCPVVLSLRQDDHLDELIRELQLIHATGEQQTSELTDVISGLLGRHAHARHLGRRVAQDALAAGETTLTITLPVSVSAAQDIQELDEAVQKADAQCEQSRLLTLASPPDVRALRTWMVQEFVHQIEHDAAPRPFRLMTAS
jgi:anti-sigma regulatory factor (Ser/Thr protein kinase)